MEAAAQAVARRDWPATWDAFLTLAAFRRPQTRFARIAEPGRDPGQREDRNQRRESPRPASHVKYKAAESPGQRARVGHPAHHAGEQRERHSEQTGDDPPPFITRSGTVKALNGERSNTSVTGSERGASFMHPQDIV